MTGRRRTMWMRAGAVTTAVAAIVALVAPPGYGQETLAAAQVTVSGRVTDGSGHGWPLYARVDVADVGTFFTNPGTGRYEFLAAPEATYNLTVTPLYRGYQGTKTDVVVGTGNKTANVSLKVDGTCTAPGYAGQLGAPILTEEFNEPTAPAGWQVVNRTPSGGWVFTDEAGRGNLTGGSGGFAIADSDDLGSGNTQDTDLIMPAQDFTSLANPILRFNSDFRALAGDSAAIDVSTDGGANWTNVWRTTSSQRGPRVEEVPLTPLGGVASGLIRFHYIASFDWWWEVDNVVLLNRECGPVPGGLVVGVVTDRNTSAGLVGATVFSVDAPTDRATTVATPADPNLPDGFYHLFSTLTGDHAITAALSPYVNLTKTVNVPLNGARRVDFPLRAGRVTVEPTGVGTFQPYGSTQSTTLTVTNNGTAPATVNLSEQDGGFVIMLDKLAAKQGAADALVEIPGGLDRTLTGPAKASSQGFAAAAPAAVDDTWTRIANYPVSVYDNGAATLNGKVYSVGAQFENANVAKAFVHDPAADTWTALPDLPSGRTKPQVAAVGGKLYVFGGFGTDSNMVSTVDVFDPSAGSWSTLAGTDPKPRAGAGIAVAGGKVYQIGGCLDGDCTAAADVTVFDPQSGAFDVKTSYPHPSSWIQCGGIGARVYCAGGLDGDTELTDAFAFDPAANSWSPIANLPINFWAAPHSVSGGLLVITGGATGNTVTNRSIGYDPQSNAWIDLPAVQFTRFRGAGACGGFKVAGNNGTSAGPESERLGGLDCTTASTNVPWLSLGPLNFTLAAGASRTVTVTLTATPAAGVTQPGRYTAQISVATDTPYQVESIPVEMNVLPPANSGKVQGTARGQGCTGPAAGLPATLRFNPVTGGAAAGLTVVAGTNGSYAVWLPAGAYDVIVAKDGWVPIVQRITITASVITTTNPLLTPVQPC